MILAFLMSYSLTVCPATKHSELFLQSPLCCSALLKKAAEGLGLLERQYCQLSQWETWFIFARLIPEGTAIFVPPYVLHRDSRYFSPSPDKFWPERWLIADESTDKTKPQPGFVHNTSAFIPFSFGPANCVGKYLAYREMQVVITSIIQRYDFQFAEGYDPDQFLRDLKDDVVLVKGKLPVALTKRA